MTVPTFAARRKAWSSPPVDDIGYIPSTDLLAMTDEDFKQLMREMQINRYGGWRNHRNRWWDLFGLGQNQGRVLDYGCGVGMEGLQFALAGSTVWLADISKDNVLVAQRLFALYGQEQEGWVAFEGEKAPLSWQSPAEFDLIHCCGVLHHIPEPVPVIQKFHELLVDGGRVNLMVYSDQAWRIATGGEAARNWPVSTHPRFEQFWTHWDPIGGYADWYDRTKLEQWFGEWFTVDRCEPLTEHGEYLGAVLVKK